MITPEIIIALVVICGLSALVTGIIRRHALRADLVDIPNERSSHATPTPRGGGMGIVAGFVAGLTGMYALGLISLSLFAGFLISGLLVAAVGYVDDHGHVSAKWRLLVHLIASIWLLYSVGGMHPLDLGFTVLHWGLIGDIIGVVGLVWLINLYNFMDGIDGFAASEAVFVAGAAGLMIFAASGHPLGILTLILAAASLGFLFWNWHPAKIFMGDIGSGFLGVMLGGLAIASTNHAGFSPWIWLLLLSVFVFDATFTLIRRIIRRDRVWEPHRMHLYQRATDRWGHQRVTLGLWGVNLTILISFATSMLVTIK